MLNQIHSFNKSFNAKSTSKQSLCDSFIPNSHFDRLISPNHTVMVGPRGSGKTTLLRMCEAEALNIWESEQSNEYRSKVDFSGVFIPTDRFWKAQFDRLSKIYKANNLVLKLLNSAFTYHVLECFSCSLVYRALKNKGSCDYKKIELSKEVESELVGYLADLWCVEVKIPSLRGLSIALTMKKLEVSSYISSLSGPVSKNLAPIFVESELISLMDASISIVNQYFGELNEKWALLFDELELAPDSFVQPLLNNMRGGPQNIILKLALSPYHKDVSITEDSFSSMHKQDLSFINLSGVRDDGVEFAKALSNYIFKQENLLKPIEEYFEGFDIDRDKEFEELASNDDSFSDYLKSQKVLGKKYSSLRSTEKDVVRRIQFNVHLRNYHRARRKRPSNYYTGFLNICNILDYNPRMLIGVMSIFASIAKSEGIVKSHKQIECINEYYQSFKALLNTIAVESDESGVRSLYDVIQEIAQYFHQQIHGGGFSPSPKGSITFKNDYNENYMDAIGLALNAGALVIEKNEIDAFQDINNLRGARCRLSYIFSPEYRLLMNLQPPVDLVTILNHKRLKVFNILDSKITQMELNV
ncbi:hypothetical protein [Pseudoalteromonas sp. P1-25]|uniref:ORC-CDC6 family AAA ATPase n=1 Tax=Pseudoalteromonas sp. P1-25 TaxID=1723758 RepID=UPI0006D65CD3|nr:hypothetical protein [Pseudoalteromonas sp. P1-25]KPZ56862.1 hypothetical protein AN393_01026 [Pseudoalteromonas sp. P1-25]